MQIKPERMPMPSLGQPDASESPAAEHRPQPQADAAHDGKPKRSGAVGDVFVLALLHRSPDLRHGAVDRHHADRRDRALSGCRSRSIRQITPPGGRRCRSAIPGASAQVVADTVAAPIEQQVNGVEGMLYMSSQMGNDGSYTLTVTFDVGTDLNTALVMVQNRVALAMPQLPDAGAEPGDHDPQADARHPDDRQLHSRPTAATTTST